MTPSQDECTNLIVTRVEALGFRSLRYVAQDIGPFQVLVGPNESGKSAFMDVLSFLADLQRVCLEHAFAGFLPLQIPAGATSTQQLAWMGRNASFELAIEAKIPSVLRQQLQDSDVSACRYEIAVKTVEPYGIAKETFFLKPDSERSESVRSEFPSPPSEPKGIIIDSDHDAPEGWYRVISRDQGSECVTFRAETSMNLFQHRVACGESALAFALAEEEFFPVATWFHRVLAEGVQRIALSSEAMRRPSPPPRRAALGLDGSNLPHVVDAFIKADPSRYSDWLMHVREALPDIELISTTTQPGNGHRYLVIHYRNGLKAPSWLVSEGTVRLLALTLLAYLPVRTGPYLIEEPENGIHPCNLETVLQSLSWTYDYQVLLVTHSPDIARMASLDQLLCFSRDDDGCTDVVTGSAHPLLQDWTSTMDLGILLGSGALG